MRTYREFNTLLPTISGVPARIALGSYALPDFLFVAIRHEYPFSDLGNRTTAAPANIIKGSRADCNARGIGSSGRSVIHDRVIGGMKQKILRPLKSPDSGLRRNDDATADSRRIVVPVHAGTRCHSIKQCAAQDPADRHPGWLRVARILSPCQPSSRPAKAHRS